MTCQWVCTHDWLYTHVNNTLETGYVITDSGHTHARTHRRALTEALCLCSVRSVWFYGIGFCITLLFSSNILDFVCVCVRESHRYTTNYMSSPPYTHSSCISISCCSSEHSDKTSSQTCSSTENGTHTHTHGWTHSSFIPSVCYHTFSRSTRQTLKHRHEHLWQSRGSPCVCVCVSPTCTIGGVRMLACPDGTTLCVLPTCVYVMLKRALLSWQ